MPGLIWLIVKKQTKCPLTYNTMYSTIANRISGPVGGLEITILNIEINF